MRLPISLKSKIIHGNKLGRKIGFPTANYDLANLYVNQNSFENNFNIKTLKFKKLEQGVQFLATGIYACKAFYQNEEYLAAGYIGTNKTFEKEAFKLEVHIFDFDKNIYSKELITTFYKKIREDKKFFKLEKIKLQIQKDCVKIREYFNINNKLL